MIKLSSKRFGPYIFHSQLGILSALRLFNIYYLLSMKYILIVLNPTHINKSHGLDPIVVMQSNVREVRFRENRPSKKLLVKKSHNGRVGGLMPNQCFTLPRTISDLNMFLRLINWPTRG